MGFHILEAVQAWHTPWLDWLMIFFSRLGNGGMLWVVVTVLLLLHKPTREAGMICGLSLLFSLLLCNLILKPLVLRPRPFTQQTLDLLIPPPTGASFPSGHASSSFAGATGLSVIGPKIAIPAYIVAAIISFSRIYLQVHFPGDVLAGAVLGIGCGVLARWLVMHIQARNTARKTHCGGDHYDR